MPGPLSFFNQIDDLRSHDREALYRLDKLYFPVPWSDAAWESFFKNHNDYLIVLSFENLGQSQTINGFALWQNSNADSFSHLLKIIVDPQKRKEGAGEALLKSSISHLHQLGVKNFFLEVEENNLNAFRLYLKMGFKVIHKKPHFYSNGEAALIMTLVV